MDEIALILLLVVGGIVVIPIVTLVVCIRIRHGQSDLAHEVLELRDYVHRHLTKPKPDPQPSVAAVQPVPKPVVGEVERPKPVTAKPVAAEPTALEEAVSKETESLRPAVTRPEVQLPEPRARPELLGRPVWESRYEPEVIPEPGRFEIAARRILLAIWNWIIVGDEHRKPGTSVEYAVATNWLVRVGVLIVLVGIGFFLDYTSSRGWLGPIGKVSMSLLAGAGFLIAGILMLGRKYHLLGQGFLGAGLATWYAAVFASHQLYSLITAGTAFALMAAVTIGAGVIAVRFQSLLTAILGVLGGFGTPIMLSADAVNFVGLFSYMLFLGAGVLGISYYRHWHLLNLLAFIATWLLAGMSMGAYEPAVHFWQVMPFLTAFFILYSLATIIQQFVRDKETSLLDFFFLMTNAGLYFGFSYKLVAGFGGTHWVALVSVGMAAFYTALLYATLIRRRQDLLLLLSFLGLASFFLIITVPLLLSKQWLTFCWSLQALILLWAALKLDSQFVRKVAYILYLIVLCRFFFVDLDSGFARAVPGNTSLVGYFWIVLERIISFGGPIASFAMAMKLLNSGVNTSKSYLIGDEFGHQLEPGSSKMRIFAGIVVFAMVFIFLHLEIHNSLRYLWNPARLPALTLLWASATVVLVWLYQKNPHKILLAIIGFFVTATLLKLFFYDLNSWNISVVHYLYLPGGQYSFPDAGLRLLDFAMIGGLLVYLYRLLRSDAESVALSMICGVASIILLFIYSTLELNSFLAAFLPGLRAGGISVLWGVFAFGLIFSGILRGLQGLRYAGLSLFCIAAFKVFFYDLAQLDPIYKIVAFTLLGIILLSGAFAYLKFQDRFRMAGSDNIKSDENE